MSVTRELIQQYLDSVENKPKKRKMKFRLNEHVRILQYAEDGINGYGRVDQIRPGFHKPYRVVNLNMPFAGTVSDWFSASELGKVKRRR